MVNFTVSDLRNDERYRKAEAEHQFNIPKKFHRRMRSFSNVPWVVATDLYVNAVKMVLLMYNVEILIDIPFGLGYAKSAELFFDAMENANKSY